MTDKFWYRGPAIEPGRKNAELIRLWWKLYRKQLKYHFKVS